MDKSMRGRKGCFFFGGGDGKSGMDMDKSMIGCGRVRGGGWRTGRDMAACQRVYLIREYWRMDMDKSMNGEEGEVNGEVE